jgi:subtilisin family serine protease
VAGVDGVITTFFYKPGYYNYPFAFFGTSASGPTVAGVVALVLQAAGGPGSLQSQQVRSILETTASPRRGVQEMVRAGGANDGSNISVTALGSYIFGANYRINNHPKGRSFRATEHDATIEAPFGRPFRAGVFWAIPRAKALGCSVKPFHG